MEYQLETEVSKKGRMIFKKVKDKSGIYYIVRSEHGKLAYKTRDWVIKHSKDIINLKITSDNRLVVKRREGIETDGILGFKQKQLSIILKANRIEDDYHVGIRGIEDIKIFKEVIEDEESFCYGDFDLCDALEALRLGRVRVYSSKPIVQGNFVSTSKNMAKDYAGSGRIYEKEVLLTDIAWINGDEGQVEKVQ